MSNALIIGGGAPKSALMSGALYALNEKGVEFKVISASGSGALVAMLFIAPKSGNPSEALNKICDFGIDDTIYSLFPVNYKVFHKPGFHADMFRKYYRLINSFIPFSDSESAFPGQRMYNDWINLLQSIFCPTELNFFSQGLCANAPFVEDIIDFNKINNSDTILYINAYNITDSRMENFSNNEITPAHLYASLSFPFIYPPYELNGKYYYEGASLHALNYRGLKNHSDIDTIVVFDVLGTKNLIRKPRNIYDAWVKSLIVPLVEIAKKDTKIFELKHNNDNRRNILKIHFDIPEEQWPLVLDWSYSNQKKLFEIGYDSGINFYKQNYTLLNP
ncbi:MAG: patatin-like phospholipase family protein [Desulfobacteraceae bacterium]|nr:patatin-like phospholipase family protein [Desulfobacteraceae bacterium]